MAGEIETVDCTTPQKVMNVGSRGRVLKRPAELPEHVTRAKTAMDEAFAEADQPEAPQEKKRRKGRNKTQRRRPEPPAEGGEEPEHKAADFSEVTRVVGQPLKRRRTCKKKVPTLEEKKMSFTQKYLASLGVTWGRCQWYHSNHPVDDDAQLCKKNGGFVTMRQRLANLQPPECLTCMALLQDSKFEFEKFELEIKDMEGGVSSSPFTKLQKRLATAGVAMPAPPLPAPSDAPHGDDTEPEHDPTAGIMVLWDYEKAEEATQKQETEEAMWKLFRSMKCLELLEPASNGKSLPARCKACTSASQPQGKIFDLHARRQFEIDFFTRQRHVCIRRHVTFCMVLPCINKLETTTSRHGLKVAKA